MYSILCKYYGACLVNTNKIFCVQVKNKPCVEYTIIMRLISWIHSHSSEIFMVSSNNFFGGSLGVMFKCSTDLAVKIKFLEESDPHIHTAEPCTSILREVTIYPSSAFKILCRDANFLKVHLHEIFHFKLVWPKEPI